MFVHRVVVIHVELHHRAHGLELRQKGREHTKFVHAPQRALGIAVFQQQVEKELLRRRIVAEPLVDKREVFCDHEHGVGMDQKSGAQRLLEQPQQVERIGQKGRLVGDGQPPGDLDIPRAQPLAPLEQPLQQRLGLVLRRLKLGQEDAREIAHGRGVAEIVLHEDFHAPPTATVSIAHAVRDLDLHVKGQLVIGTPRDEVQMTAHRPEETLGAGECAEFLLREGAKRHQIAHISDVMQVFGDPEQRLQVAQPALALLHVGLDHVALALLFMARVALGELGLGEFALRAGKELVT